MNGRVWRYTIYLGAIAIMLAMSSTQVYAQDVVPVSVSLSGSDAPVATVPTVPLVKDLPDTGFGAAFDTTNIVFMAMIAMGLTLIYVGTVTTRRGNS